MGTNKLVGVEKSFKKMRHMLSVVVVLFILLLQWEYGF